MRRSVSALVAALLVLVLASGGVIAASNAKFSVNLKGENEVGGGDSDAAGQAHLEFFSATDTVCYTIKWSKLDVVTGAHIHVGAVGVDGGIVTTLFGGPLGTPTAFPGEKFTTSGCVPVVDALGTSWTNAILADPANFYVNIHTGPTFFFAIRGQLK